MRKDKYTLKFQFFGKKMKTTVYASDEERAKQMVRDRIKFDSVELTKVYGNFSAKTLVQFERLINYIQNMFS